MSKSKQAAKIRPQKSEGLSRFIVKVEKAMAKINNLDEFRKLDSMVNFVFDVGHTLFDKELDTVGTDWLIRYGGRLTGAYAYLGQKAAYVRAERDVYEQKASEVEKELMLDKLAENTGYRVTQARAEISAEISELKDLVIAKEAEKNQWENTKEACNVMVSFMQSAIKTKEGERFKSNRLQ